MKEETAFYYRNSLDAFKTIYQQEGLKGFYRGFLPSLWGTLHVAIQFPLYEYLKRECPHWMDSPNNRISDDNGKYLTLVLISSVLSKLVASTVTYPHEVIRTRSQVYTAVIVAAATTTHDQPLGRTPTMRQIIKMIYRENGIQGFYRGLTTNFIRVLPASGITFVTYEFLLHQLQSLSQSQSRVGYKL